MFIADCK